MKYWYYIYKLLIPQTVIILNHFYIYQFCLHSMWYLIRAVTVKMIAITCIVLCTSCLSLSSWSKCQHIIQRNWVQNKKEIVHKIIILAWFPTLWHGFSGKSEVNMYSHYTVYTKPSVLQDRGMLRSCRFREGWWRKHAQLLTLLSTVLMQCAINSKYAHAHAFAMHAALVTSHTGCSHWRVNVFRISQCISSHEQGLGGRLHNSSISRM